MDLTNLRKLWLDFNRLKQPPQRLFSNLTALEQLNLQNQRDSKDNPQLESLPTFDTLINLNWCCLVNNKLHTVPANLFRSVTKLRTLLLQHNYLSGSERDFRRNLSISERVQISWVPQANQNTDNCIIS